MIGRRGATAAPADRDRRHRARGPVLAGVAVVALLLTGLLTWTGALDDVERSTVDARFALRGDDAGRLGPVPIAVVAIDDRTLGALDERFPFRRRHHAGVLRRLTAAGVRAIAYDVEFTEPTTVADDNALIEAIADAPRVVLAASETDEDGATAVLGGAEVLDDVGAHVGHTRVDVDGDGVLRRFDHRHGGLDAFAVVVAEQATGRPVDRRPFADGPAWIDWPGGARTVPTHAFVDVLRGRVDASLLRDRIVVVGATAPSLKDVQVTPTDDGRPLAGPEIQADVVATVLRGVPLRDAWAGWGVLLTVVAASLPALAARRLGPFGTLVASGAGGVAVAGVAFAAFAADRVLPVAEPLLALGLATLGSVTAGAAFAVAERARIRDAFGRFVSRDVVDEVLARADDGLRLGGVRVDVTVLFCDLRGSTALLEAIEPERGIAVLNRFLGAMSDAVDAHGGTLVGYRGDGLMAVFGAPLEQADHADRALAAAREMAGPALERCHDALRRDGVDLTLSLGVGVASGPVMAGNVGSERRMEYTAIGDAANLAARLEGMTKAHPHPILLTGDTVARLAERPDDAVPLGELAVQGRAGAIATWGAG
ncbi:MAG: adenylate/guanylate cyclase domain-containing protein [Solirubrobacteraceae bacterium]|nr:adenylate/guanylate cyclase domain-containing protein [Solirubrobacteraceae bacterium]